VLQTYTPPDKVTSLHSVSLDPDGTSVWLCCDLGQVMRFDIGSGMLLTSWPTSSALAIAVYAPPAPPRHHHHHHHPGHLPWHR
jgi:hypothetical protein